MEEDKLTARIRPLESFAAANPGLYRFRVALLASLGYAYLLFTHPALGDRLGAIGFQKEGADVTRLIEAIVTAGEVNHSAAAEYLRELPEDFEPSMNRLWRERIAHPWSERHEEIKKSRKRLAELDEQAKTRALTVEEQWERAVVLSETEDRAASVPAIEAVLKETPDHVGANYALGTILLEQGKAEGIDYLEKTMQSGPEIAREACQLISGFYLEQGNTQLAETFRARAEEHNKKAARLQEQALTFTARDQFAPHDLQESRIKELQTQLGKVRGLAAAYFVRKLLEDSEQSIYVLAVIAGYSWREGISGKHIEPLFEDLSAKVNLPSPVVILSLDGEHGFLMDRISAIGGALVFATPDYGATDRH